MTEPVTNPGAYGFLALLRRLERGAGGKPRIGRNRTLKNEIANLGQDPFLAFPENDISAIQTDGKAPRIRTQFLGFFGPQGALPLNTTEEVLQWFEAGDDAFVRFTDIFAARFQQLFFRAWSDARAISQFDHPEDDRFATYLGALSGIGTPAYRRRDRVEDVLKLPMVGLHAARVKSPVRLRQMLEVHFGADIRVEEHVPSWMEFEANSQSRLGQQGATLGRDMHLGARVQSVNEKICLHIRTADLTRYRRFLPSGPDHASLKDIVFWYVGKSVEVDVALSLPADQVAPAAMGKSAELGWMACIAPPKDAASDYIEVSRFSLDTPAAEAA